MPYFCGALILLVDQWSKHTVKGDRALTGAGFLRLTLVRHREPWYESLLGRRAMVLLWILALVSAVTLVRYTPMFQSGGSAIGLGLAFGGAASNLVDILYRRYVIDFIDFGWWPVFNLADVGIVAGLAMAFLL